MPGLALGVALAAGPARAQHPRSTVDYHSSSAEIVSRGTQALKLCNGLFVSNRTVEQIYAQEFRNLGARDILPLSKVQVDAQRKTVAVGVGTSDSLPAMRAAYREGVGCVTMAADQTFDDVDHLPQLRMPPPPGDPATIPWPDGDLIANQALPAHVDRAALNAAADWTFDRAAHGGHDGHVTLSLLVVHRGDILLERYAPGITMQTRTRTWSTAKSITSSVIGIAVDRGLLALDQPLPFTWPPGDDPNADDPRKRITLRHVLHMSSGLYPIDNDFENVIGSQLAYWAGWDSAYHARNRGLVREPGTTMDYENYDSLLAVFALRAALGDERTYLEFPRRHLFDRIGMRNTVAGVDRFGNFLLSSQVYTNARDLARLGILYLNRGKWNGEQILSEEWVRFARTPAPASRASGNGYGGHFWLVPDSRTDLPQDAYATSGARGQYTIIVPSYDLVIVRRGFDERGGRRPGFSQWNLLAEVLKAFPRGHGGMKEGS
jgi:CubicO group peptidase (beta-lactamase class C family)